MLMAADSLVKRATPLDGPLMAAIHATCFARAWDETAMAQFLASPDAYCLIASASGAPQGLLIARKVADEAEILTLGVMPACRRAGVARALLVSAVAILRASDVRKLHLEVDEGNEAALRLYRSFGAIQVGKRPGYYEHKADAAIFSLAL
jgi:ribosomal-protein-alanine N-acetyltransferase